MASLQGADVPEHFALPALPEIKGVDPTRSVVEAFRIAAAKVVADAWEEDIEKIFPAVELGKKGADLSVAVVRFKRGKPADILPWVNKITESFQPSVFFSKVSSPDGKFLWFTFNRDAFGYHILRQINLTSAAALAKPEEPTLAYGTTTEGAGKHLVVDFSSPNIAKPFHAGHLRSTIIGTVISNLYEANGWKVTRLNYLGDWGTQYGLLSIGFDKYGNEEELQKDAIKHLFEVYVKINNAKAEQKEKIDAGETIPDEENIHLLSKKVFKDMEDGEPKAIAQWARFRDLSIEKLKGTYEKLNVKFDVYWGESQVSNESMERAVKIVQDKGLTCEDRGALLVDLVKFKMDKAIVRKGADGTSIYLTRDLGGAYDKYQKYAFDKHIYVVQAAQTLHFNQLFKTLELMGEPYADKLEHVTFGLVKGMSTRKGTVVFLEDIIQEATTTMHDQMKSNEAKYAQVENPEETSAIIGTSAVKIQDMAGRRINDYDFNMSRCTSFEGDFGPFIQYSHVRLCSVQRKNPNVPLPTSINDINVSLLNDPKILDILMQLALYPTALRNAYVQSEPSQLVTWCFRLSHLVGAAWETVRVTGEEEEVAKARLFFYITTREVLASAMRLLSLTPIERM
ncbi:arginine-tRNA ligase [Cryptococcus wingfieldii CBS 7118]|uniref:arginine--tRNA ligase n=1 Tax=Cryptococcus wingfieldii CBS 7118 TaxID=1295528 RepID=A0A1E3IFJ9_9TREE|nr:arginine-tRNA ligase [Cryptococcus wingfieldii CBS 7118]ODN87394.1 arginine-tRNA ligase [Cryptococcus wingfieldii CBS 7118]